MEQSQKLCRHRLRAAALCLTILFVPEIAASAPAVKLNIDEAHVPRDSRVATSIAPIAKKDSPDVVNIFTTRKARAFPPLDEPFSQFFRSCQGDGSVPRQRREQSLALV
jgi:S1-C subfamily serine protease